MPADDNQNESVDALCRECGNAFKTYVDRILGPGDGATETRKVECPVCGCNDCKIGH
ncbi:MAG: hypothetical protein JRH12_03595 [Deltaproteobacteria bacterium]|jgi:hypothetical protein|nr:hypothetical protein [Deltaproteobacteria bacterium]MBW2480254.1 hypothetical protein [Deltaproteobacteria bacterium]